MYWQFDLNNSLTERHTLIENFDCKKATVKEGWGVPFFITKIVCAISQITLEPNSHFFFLKYFIFKISNAICTSPIHLPKDSPLSTASLHVMIGWPFIMNPGLQWNFIIFPTVKGPSTLINPFWGASGLKWKLDDWNSFWLQKICWQGWMEKARQNSKFCLCFGQSAYTYDLIVQPLMQLNLYIKNCSP